MHKIVVGVDVSPGSTAALHWALREARHHGAMLELVLAWEFPPVGDYSATPSGDELERSATAQLATVIGDVDTEGVEIVATCKQGPPSVVLVEAAQDADLLVVGSHGHGAFVGMMIGSVSLRVVTHATCPVVVVPSPHA